MSELFDGEGERGSALSTAFFLGSVVQIPSGNSLAAIGAGVVISLGLLFANPSSAQWTPPGGGGGGSVTEPNLFEGSEAYRQTVGQSASLPSVEFGDSWNHDTGEISFSLTDLSIPGNSGLRLVMSRSRARTSIAYRSTGMLADWELSLPRVEYVWRAGAEQFWEATRCRNPKPAVTYNAGSKSYKPGYFHFGMNIAGLDGRSEMLLDPYSSWPTAALGAPPELTTKSMWRVACLPNATNGHDGFLATSPDGTTYRFDREIHRRGVKNFNGGTTETNIQISVYPSAITDAHGNTLTYTYGVHGPTKIQANDGRMIDFTYNSSGHITSISSNSRTWTYHYQTRHGRPFLHRVVQPDGKQWRYEGFESLDWANFIERDYLDCTLLPYWGGIGWRPGYNLDDIEVVHPNGTRLEATFDLIKNGRTRNTPRTTPNYWHTNRCRQSQEHLDNHVVSLAVAEKRIVQASGAIDTWSYAYSEDEGSYSNEPVVLSDTKLRTEFLPDGTRREHDVYRMANQPLEGEIFETRVYNTASGGSPIQVYSSTFDANGYSFAAGQDTFPDSNGAPQGEVTL